MVEELKSEYKFYRFSLIWGAISSLLILLLIKGGLSIQAVFALKDIVIYCYAFLLFKSWLKNNLGSTILLFFFLVYLVYNYFILNPEYPAPINNIRQLIAPLFLLIIYTGINLSETAWEKLLKLLCYITIVIFAFGLVEQVFQLWEKVNLSEFFRLKNIPVNSKGLSYMFYEPMFGGRERMTSILLDPISLGHFFATIAAYLFYLKKDTKLLKVTLCLSVLGLFLCLSKGAILQFGICVFFFNRKINILIRIVGFIFPLLIMKTVIDTLGLDIAGILLHIGGLDNAIKTMSFFGHGIGAAGNYASMFSGKNDLGIGDTFVGAVIGQIGIFGCLIWIILGCVIINMSKAISRRSRVNAVKIFISIFLVSVLSENTLNVTSFLLPAIIIGLCINTSERKFSL